MLARKGFLCADVSGSAEGRQGRVIESAPCIQCSGGCEACHLCANICLLDAAHVCVRNNTVRVSMPKVAKEVWSPAYFLTHHILWC